MADEWVYAESIEETGEDNGGAESVPVLGGY